MYENCMTPTRAIYKSDVQGYVEKKIAVVACWSTRTLKIINEWYNDPVTCWQSNGINQLVEICSLYNIW